MTWLDAVWMAVGLFLGILHATGIWRSARHAATATALSGIARVMLVGFALVAAAIFGGIVMAAAGWAVGFFTSVGVHGVTSSRISQRRALW